MPSTHSPHSSTSSADAPETAPLAGPAPISPSDPPSSASPSSPHRKSASAGSDGYPSWLPRRPPPPAPASTFHSSAGAPSPGPSDFAFAFGGRRPTPRSVRIVNVPGHRAQPTDTTRVPSGPLAFSKATGAPVAAYREAHAGARRPRFRAAGMNAALVESPSAWTRAQFFLFPVVALAHIPLQTYFDFNAVYILLDVLLMGFLVGRVAKHPNPLAPGVPGSGRGWALGGAAYIACWAVWLLLVVVLHDFVYSFLRRWRVKRPPVFPLYLSAPGHTFAAMTSYAHFCFLRRIRRAAFPSSLPFSSSSPESPSAAAYGTGAEGSWRDGLAETCWFYAQNLPTVALLLPRAALALALLLTFSAPNPSYLALADAAGSPRDGTFFRADGTLSAYARGVLIANAAWAAWRAIVLIGAGAGLWALSGHACGGLCGPRYRWEEGALEKRASVFSVASEGGEGEGDAVPWGWRDGARERVAGVWEFCVSPALRYRGEKERAVGEKEGELPEVVPGPAFDARGMEAVMAAVGFPSSPAPARRGVLTGDLFEGPVLKEVVSGVPDVKRLSAQHERGMAGPSGPLYPFVGHPAQIEGGVPFPPSPDLGTATSISSDAEVEGDDEQEEEEEDGVGAGVGDTSVEQGRTSGSMSSLGHPVSSRYPFQFRLPQRAHGPASRSSHTHSHSHSHSTGSKAPSHATSHSANSRSANSRSANSRSTHGSASRGGYAADVGSPHSIPMPPRHPRGGRARAGTAPSTSPTPGPVAFPTGHSDEEEDDEEDEEEEEEGEGEMVQSPVSAVSEGQGEEEDSVGLLSPGTSPRTSLVRSLRNSTASSRSHSRSRAGSAVSSAARSRAQSLIHSLGAASRSSVELVQAVRSRTHSSMARLEEDMSYRSRTGSSAGRSSAGRSRTGSSAGGSVNGEHTFGLPLAPPRESAEEAERAEEGEGDAEVEAPEEQEGEGLPPSPSVSVTAPSEDGHAPPSPSQNPSMRTVSPHRLAEQAAGSLAPSSYESRPDISTAAPSFVTDAATLEGTSGSSGFSHAPAHRAHHAHHAHHQDPSVWGPA
ncbi:hypothetical protein HWV62_12697 [Athelia sp. TMB]|nr:hypothetical protein HWV62_12697 [Athelia sp. TMB]